MASGDRRKRLSGELPKRLSARPNPRLVLRVGRNEPCPCGSGKKYKDCHLSAGEDYLSKLAMDRAAQEEKQRGGGGGVIDWLRRLLGR